MLDRERTDDHRRAVELLALREIFFGQRRFDQIVYNTGASRDILATRLRTLVEAGVLQKRQYHSRPARYEYVPTEAGRALEPVLLALMDWGDRYVTPGPPPTVWRHACGARLQSATICLHCGEQVREGELRLIRLGKVE